MLLLADALNIPRFNWLGWSSGGNTGLVLAALHGHRLGRMASHAGMAGGPCTSEHIRVVVVCVLVVVVYVLVCGWLGGVDRVDWHAC